SPAQQTAPATQLFWLSPGLSWEGSKGPFGAGLPASGLPPGRTYSGAMKHILLSIDSSAPSWEATRLAVHVAPKLKVPVTVITVVISGSRRQEIEDGRPREHE